MATNIIKKIYRITQVEGGAGYAFLRFYVTRAVNSRKSLEMLFFTNFPGCIDVHSTTKRTEEDGRGTILRLCGIISLFDPFKSADRHGIIPTDNAVINLVVL